MAQRNPYLPLQMSKRQQASLQRKASEALAKLFPGVDFGFSNPGSLPELWVKDRQSTQGFGVKFGSGKAGISATIRHFVGCSPVTVTGNRIGDCMPIPQTDAFEVSATVYRTDEHSQAFKRWYGADAEGREDNPYPFEVSV